MNKHRGLKRTLKILLGLFLVWGVLALLPRPQSVAENPLVIEKKTKPLLIAHGGGNQEFPDNTLEAYYNAYSIDPKCMLETDVSMTKDGVIILSHDTTLDRKTDVSGAIIDFNYSDLVTGQVDFGYENQVEPESNGTNVSGQLIKYKNYRGVEVTPLDVVYPEGVFARHETKFLVTTLRELIMSFPDNPINVEIKQSGSVGLQALAQVIKLMNDLNGEYHTFRRIVLASFHKEVFDEMVRLKNTTHKDLLYSPEYDGVTKFYVLQLLKLDIFFRQKTAVLQIPMEEYGLNLATRSLISAAHRHNIAVHYWTINDRDDMLLLIRNGADGIMTDRPSLLKEVYDEMF
jgi:glycerophosphoryl diester phosphodiesterase